MAAPMNPALDNSVSQITNGFYTIAIAALILGVLAVFVGSRFGGKSKRQRKATADLVWAFGLLLLGVFLIPKLFGSGG